MPAPPPARKIPGITVEDPFPHGCVDCHINYVEMNLDTRFSTLLKQWTESVEPKLLAKAQAAAPKGLRLEGKHPEAADAIANIPGSCNDCHGKDSTTAPRFAQMMHTTHLGGGEENHYMTMFQGECTYCHKFDSLTGDWNIPSAPER